MYLLPVAVPKVNNREQVLRGQLPASFAKLDQLRVLELSTNELYGTLPDLSRASQLTSLKLDFNRFVGTMPQLSNLVNLELLAIKSGRARVPSCARRRAHPPLTVCAFAATTRSRARFRRCPSR